MRILLLFISLSWIFLPNLSAQQQNNNEYLNNWPQWRGPLQTGMAPAGNPPVEWSETKNVKWKTEIPGRGHATPIIWENQVFISTAIPVIDNKQDESANAGQGGGMQFNEANGQYKFAVISVDRNTGKILWETTVYEGFLNERTHESGSFVSNSSVTDGKYIYAYFGSRGLYCLDIQGNIIWEKKLGKMETKMSFGEGSSPALYNGKLVIVWDHEGPSFITCIDAATGKDIWKFDRDEATSWASPQIVEVDGKPQVLTSATGKIRSYDLETGEIIWECEGMTSNVIPVPLIKDGIAYFMSGYRGNAILAIRLSGAKGDITGTDAVIWSYNQNTTSYTPSPVLADNKLYFLRANNGSLSCLDAKDGEEYYTGQRLEGTGNLFSSPIGVNNKFYVVGESGTGYVVKMGTEFEILAENTLEDSFIASPVILDDDLFLRGFKHLYCIAQD